MMEEGDHRSGRIEGLSIRVERGDRRWRLRIGTRYLPGVRRDRLNLPPEISGKGIRNRLRFAIKAAQFFKVALAGLAAARFLVVLAQSCVKLRQAGIVGDDGQRLPDLRESPARGPLGPGRAAPG